MTFMIIALHFVRFVLSEGVLYIAKQNHMSEKKQEYKIELWVVADILQH